MAYINYNTNNQFGNQVGGQQVIVVTGAQTGARGLANTATVIDAKYIHDETDPAIRNAFIRKVYAILFTQLVFTGLFMLPFILVEDVKIYVQTNSTMYFIGLFCALFGIIAISCFEDASRKFPQNYYFCFLATFGYGILLGVNAARYEIDEILVALGITTIIVVACTLFACQTRIDFTGWGPYLLAALLAFVLTAILTIFFFPSRSSFMLLSGLGAFLFSCFLIYDTQILLGGRHNKYALEVDEYVFAALNIYIDIVIIFQCLLGIGGLANE